jgi:hypothetical protein
MARHGMNKEQSKGEEGTGWRSDNRAKIGLRWDAEVREERSGAEGAREQI